MAIEKVGIALQSKFARLNSPPYQVLLEWDRLAGRMHAKKVCPVDSAHNCSGKRLGDLHLVVLPNTVLQDFLWTWHSDCLVQDKVLRQFMSEGFTGFRPRPVHVRWEQPSTEALPTLWEIQVTGWAGMARPESGIRRTERCGVCGWQTYTPFTNPELLIDTNQWDGSDFFMVWPMPRYIFITERVASFIDVQGLTGAAVIPLHQMRIPRGFGPGGLRTWMDDDRARQLGEPLDIY